jgi:hypothetical protein
LLHEPDTNRADSGSPPAFGAAPPIGTEVSPATFAAAEKLVQVPMTEKDRAQAAQNWRNSMATRRSLSFRFNRTRASERLAARICFANLVPWELSPVANAF